MLFYVLGFLAKAGHIASWQVGMEVYDVLGGVEPLVVNVSLLVGAMECPADDAQVVSVDEGGGSLSAQAEGLAEDGVGEIHAEVFHQ